MSFSFPGSGGGKSGLSLNKLLKNPAALKQAAGELQSALGQLSGKPVAHQQPYGTQAGYGQQSYSSAPPPAGAYYQAPGAPPPAHQQQQQQPGVSQPGAVPAPPAPTPADVHGQQQQPSYSPMNVNAGQGQYGYPSQGQQSYQQPVTSSDQSAYHAPAPQATHGSDQSAYHAAPPASQSLYQDQSAYHAAAPQQPSYHDQSAYHAPAPPTSAGYADQSAYHAPAPTTSNDQSAYHTAAPAAVGAAAASSQQQQQYSQHGQQQPYGQHSQQPAAAAPTKFSLNGFMKDPKGHLNAGLGQVSQAVGSYGSTSTAGASPYGQAPQHGQPAHPQQAYDHNGAAVATGAGIGAGAAVAAAAVVTPHPVAGAPAASAGGHLAPAAAPAGRLSLSSLLKDPSLKNVQSQVQAGIGQVQTVVSGGGVKVNPQLGVASHGPPIKLEVVKGKGGFSKLDDQVVDKNGKVLYYLAFPQTLLGAWNLSLHRDTAGGPLLAFLNKNAFGFGGDDIHITFPSDGVKPEFKLSLIKTNFLSSAHDFVGRDGVTYVWKSNSSIPGMGGAIPGMSTGFICMNKTNGQVVAEWKAEMYSYAGKDGVLSINSLYEGMMDDLVATGLAMEEWDREEKGASKPGKVH